MENEIKKDKIDETKKEIKNSFSNKINKVLEFAESLVSLLKSYFKKEYKEVPGRTILLIIGSFIYLVTPVDIIPDLTPILGLSDDIFIFVVLYKSINKDILQYQEWCKKNKKK